MPVPMSFCRSRWNDTIFENDGSYSYQMSVNDAPKSHAASDGIGQQDSIGTAIAA
jgi:hypothetical protein